MNLNLIVNLVGQASLLKNSLLNLSRIKNGPLDARSKRAVSRLVQTFQQNVNNLNGLPDPALQVVLANMDRIAQNLADCPSDNNGGYARIESLYAQIIAEMGFIQGYIYALSYLHNLKRTQGIDLNTQFA